MDIGIIRDPSHTFGMTGNRNTSIVIPTERSDEESQGSTAKNRSLTYVRDDRKPKTPALSFRQSVATRNQGNAKQKEITHYVSG